MLETIYTIPVNEAFEAGLQEETQNCPFCRLYEKLQTIELDTILGAAMMEPDVRIKTNEEGFCQDHYQMMLHAKNKLGLALMLESHLEQLKKELTEGPLAAGESMNLCPRWWKTPCIYGSRIEISEGN